MTLQAEALAPDVASLKAARDLVRKISGAGRNERAVWGQCQGSALYQACVDLRGPAYKCSCPSRKIPCKHCLGLLLLEDVPTAEPPEWVTTWLSGRDNRKPPAEKTPDPVARAKRAEQREDRVRTGVEQLTRWLEDLARQGLASVQGESYSYFDQVAARLVDAQCPGLAREVRALSGSLGDRERFLLRLGRLHLLLQGFRKLDELPEGLRQEVRNRIGWTTSQEELLATGEVVSDRWWVVGRKVEEDEQLTTMSTWLWAEEKAQPALVLTFTPSGRPLDRSLPPGAALEADLVFFPGATRQRALVKERRELSPVPAHPRGQRSLSATLDSYAADLGENPWLSRHGVLVADVVPEDEGVRDATQLLPYARGFEGQWRMLALSGGHPVTVFGEWDGWSFLPLSVWNDSGWWEI